MGNSNNKLITNTLTIASLVLGAFFIFASKGHNPLKLSNPFSKAMTAYAGRTVFTKWESSNLGAPAYVNDYEAKTSYANSEDLEQGDTSLVNSTTFVNGKAKKGKAGKAKTIKGTVATKTSGSNRDNTLSQSTDSNSANNNFGSGGSSTPPKKVADKEKEENLNTFEYWEEPIFTKQDVAAVMKLIDSYQIQKVSAGVFYEVVNEMTQDERVNIREFGLMSLQATPSAKSFSYLAVMKNTDSDTEIRIAAETEVANYAQTNRIGYVISSLKPQASANSTRITLEAIKVVSVATKNYSELSESGNGGQTPTPNVGIETKLTQAYNALGVIAQSNDATVKSEAEKTMDDISKVITI